MNIRLGGKRNGAVLFWLLVIIVFIVVGTIIIGLYKMTKKINQPKKPEPSEAQWRAWDEEAKALAQASYPNADEVVPYRRFLLPGGFGMVTRSPSLEPPSDDLMAMLQQAGMNTMPKLPPQYGLSVTDTDGSVWELMETNGHSIHCRFMTMEEAETWGVSNMPPPDINIPMMFYHSYVVMTNSYENPIAN